jgi:hypothetical protein
VTTEHAIRCAATHHVQTQLHTSIVRCFTSLISDIRPDLEVTANPSMPLTEGFQKKEGNLPNLVGDILIRKDGNTLAVLDITTAALDPNNPRAHLEGGACAKAAEEVKIKKYKAHLVYADHLLVPFAIETGGTIGERGLAFIDSLVAGMPDKSLGEKSLAKARLFRGLSVALHRGIALKLLAHNRLVQSRVAREQRMVSRGVAERRSQ